MKTVTFPLCQHIKTDGKRCGSPALRGQRLCYHHGRQRPAPRCIPFGMPDLRDETAMLRWIANGLIHCELDPDVAGKLIYGIQVNRIAY